jgi:lysophospholipase L1-like esterase
VIVVVTLVLAELVCRMVVKNPYKRSVQRFITLKEFPPHVDRTYQVAGLGGKEYTTRVRSDAEGFIDPARRHEAPDLDLVFLGGSTTECLLVDEMSRWPAVAGPELERLTKKKINALNGGVSGASVRDFINVTVNKLPYLKRRPDVLVVMENINDAGLDFGEAAGDGSFGMHNVVFPGATVVADFIAQRVALFALFRRARAKMLARKQSIEARRLHMVAERKRPIRPVPDALLAKGVNRFKRDVSLLVQAGKLHGMKVVLISQPARFRALLSGGDDGTVWSAMPVGDGMASLVDRLKISDSYNQVMATVARESGALFLDAASKMSTAREDYYDHVHYTNQGSQKMGRLVAEELAKLLFPPASPEAAPTPPTPPTPEPPPTDPSPPPAP